MNACITNAKTNNIRQNNFRALLAGVGGSGAGGFARGCVDSLRAGVPGERSGLGLALLVAPAPAPGTSGRR